MSHFAWFARVCIIFSLLIPLQLSAEALRLSTESLDSENCCQTSGYLQMYLEPTGQLEFGQIRELSDKFTLPDRDDLNYGYQTGHVWLKLKVASLENTRWWWHFHYASLDWLTLYIEDSQGIRTLKAGDMVPRAEKALVHRKAIFPLDLAPNEITTLWVKVHSEGSYTLQNELTNNAQLVESMAEDYLMPALYFGAVLAIAAYNLLLFLVLREKAFLWYVLFVTCFCVATASLNGLGALYLWPHELNNQLMPFGYTAACLMTTLFVREFLDTARYSPNWDRYLKAAVWVTAICSVATLILPVQFALKLMSVVGIIFVSFSLICAIQAVYKRLPGARLFGLAWSLMLVGSLIMSLRNLALIPTNFFTTHALQLGSFLEILLISLGLASRFNRLKIQHSIMQQKALDAQQQLVTQFKLHEQQLEKKIQERTQELAQINQRLKHQAMTDELTGLANRAAMYQHLDLAIARAHEKNTPLALLYLDLDGFKNINDRFGHLAGDSVLQEVSQRLRESVREQDFICRLGGDEFLLICEGLTQGSALEQMTGRILLQMRTPFYYENSILPLGGSLGVAIGIGSHAEAALLIEQADQAMYKAKAKGKNCVEVA